MDRTDQDCREYQDRYESDLLAKGYIICECTNEVKNTKEEIANHKRSWLHKDYMRLWRRLDIKDQKLINAGIIQPPKRLRS